MMVVSPIPPVGVPRGGAASVKDRPQIVFDHHVGGRMVRPYEFRHDVRVWPVERLAGQHGRRDEIDGVLEWMELEAVEFLHKGEASFAGAGKGVVGRQYPPDD